MKAYIYAALTAISIFVLSGCSSIEIDNHTRITGIIEACKAQPTLRQQYLKQKVNNKEISETVSFTIQECLK